MSRTALFFLPYLLLPISVYGQNDNSKFQRLETLITKQDSLLSALKNDSRPLLRLIYQEVDSLKHIKVCRLREQPIFPCHSLHFVLSPKCDKSILPHRTGLHIKRPAKHPHPDAQIVTFSSLASVDSFLY